MCLTAILAAAAKAAPFVAAGAAIHGIEQQRKQANHAADAQAKVETTAAQTANARLAQRRRALSANALATDQGTSGMASSGRATLGGG